LIDDRSRSGRAIGPADLWKIDMNFARILVDLAHDRGLKALVALRGKQRNIPGREFKQARFTLISIFRICGLDNTRPPQARPGNPPHSGSTYFRGRKSPAWTRAGRHDLLKKSVGNESLAEVLATIEQSAHKRVEEITGGMCYEAKRNANRPNPVGAFGLDIVGLALVAKHWAI